MTEISRSHQEKRNDPACDWRSGGPCDEASTNRCPACAGTTLYRTILADPPWSYDYRNGPGNAKPWRVGVKDHYPTMTLDDIRALDVGSLAAKGAHLYLWATLPLLPQALGVVEAWGFEYSTMLTWCKPGPGMGRGWRGNTEHLIVARKRPTRPFDSVAAGSWFQLPRTRHSAKPDQFRQEIEAMSPGPYLEMFARDQRLGWDAWGNEVDSTVEVQP